MPAEYTVFGKPIENPTTAQKAFVIGFIAASLGTAVLCAPLTLAAHAALRHSGRNGFWWRTPDNRIQIHFGLRSFDRR